MTTSENKITKDRELLIRIDERLINLAERLSNIEQIIQKQQNLNNENKMKLDILYQDIYGTKNTEGIIKKVEHHDKLLTKAMAYFTIIAIIIEFCFKFYFHGL